MDKKELKQSTTKVYEDYGFVKKGKYYDLYMLQYKRDQLKS